MKNLSISLALISMLIGSQSAFAELAETPSSPTSGIEHIIVIGKLEEANFEIFSEENSQNAMKEIMNVVVASLNDDEKESVASVSI